MHSPANATFQFRVETIKPPEPTTRVHRARAFVRLRSHIRELEKSPNATFLTPVARQTYHRAPLSPVSCLAFQKCRFGISATTDQTGIGHS
jgi:hypothetical protein